MKKRVLISLMTISLGLHLTGCTSSDSSKDQDDTAVAQDDSFQEEGSGDFDDGSKTAEAAPAEGNTDVAKTDDTGAAAGGDMAATPDAGASADASAPKAGGDELALDSADPDKEFPDDVASKTTPPADAAGATAQAAPTDQGLFDNPPTAQADAGAAPAVPAEPPTSSAASAPTDVAAGSPPADATAGVVASQAAPDTAASASDLATNAGASAATASADPAPKKAFAPLQRVKDAPFEEKGANLNRYYVARAGDTTKSVSQKIYGSDRSKDLKAWNSTLKARAMKVGDKVYYNSPKDPQDTAKMLSFYEENGVAPQTYVTKDGDDLRDVSKKLLGSKDSWKEVWATNTNVESKGKVPAGVEVRYFPSGTEVAGASPSAPAPNAKGNVAANDAAGGDQGLSDVPPPPPSDMQANNGGAQGGGMNGNVPPPPDMNGNNQNGMPGAAAAGAVAGANGNVPPPPPDMGNGAGAPPAQAAAPPPPPPPPPAAPAQMNKKPAQVADSTTSDNDQTMMLGAGGLLVLGGVLAFSVLRRKKASKARIDMTQTQV